MDKQAIGKFVANLSLLLLTHTHTLSVHKHTFKTLRYRERESVCVCVCERERERDYLNGKESPVMFYCCCIPHQHCTTYSIKALEGGTAGNPDVFHAVTQ
jgi:hypothetical protein